jgi:DNA replication and repair protein RecF
MYLQHIQLNYFKNYRETNFNFCAKINAIVGNNGAGKTNLLDAIHYLSFCKSYFNTHDALSITFDHDFFAIHGTFFNAENEQTTPVTCTYRPNGRKIMKVNGKEYDTLSEHIGQFPLIMVSPYDYDLINEDSKIRRRFFDMIISQYDHFYLRQLIAYKKVLAQRNALLKQYLEQPFSDKTILQMLNLQLCSLGNYIFQKREEYIKLIASRFQNDYALLSENQEHVNIVYDSRLSQISFEQGLLESEDTDRRIGYTTFGVHKDDFLFTIEGRPIKKFGSQGQQKTFAIALKFSQLEYIQDHRRKKPILLLDDIFDKLDLKRIDALLRLVRREDIGQVFITDTDEVRVKNILENSQMEYKMFKIELP